MCVCPLLDKLISSEVKFDLHTSQTPIKHAHKSSSLTVVTGFAKPSLIAQELKSKL